MIQFMKNLSMMGAMLLVIANGTGPMSLDSWLDEGWLGPRREASPVRPGRVMLPLVKQARDGRPVRFEHYRPDRSKP